MTHPFTLTLFTPAEAERVTGLSVGMQRDWRNRGFLPKNEGHARFDAFALARMMFMKMMSDRGVGPQKSMEEAGTCAIGIVAGALREIDAYDGDHEKTLSWQKRPDALPEHPDPAEIIGKYWRARRPDLSEDEIESMLQEAIQGRAGRLDRALWSWGEKADWLRKTILKRSGHYFEPATYYVSWADGSHIFQNSLDRAFGETFSADPKATGPVIILDLHRLGGLLLERADKPIVHVEFQIEADSGLIVPPISYGTPVPLEGGEA